MEISSIKLSIFSVEKEYFWENVSFLIIRMQLAELS